MARLLRGFCGCNGAATDINDRAPPRTTYINITDDEYAEQDFGVEDAADNDEYADKDFENLVKQFRVDEKMCYYPFPMIAPLILIICDNPRASELLGHLGSTALKYCRICMADKNDSPNIICEQRNLMQAQCRLCKLNLK
eukprot:Em0002g667a